MKNWLIRIASVLRLRARFRALRKTLYRVAFVVLALGVPWCAGAFFHAFDIPVYVSWCGVILLLASLAAALFSRWGLLAAALIFSLAALIVMTVIPGLTEAFTVIAKEMPAYFDQAKGCKGYAGPSLVSWNH